MKKFYSRAASTMNYIFLRFTIGRDELNAAIKEELRLFLSDLTSESIPEDFYQTIKNEIEEGSYLDNYTQDEFDRLLSASIADIMTNGKEVDEEIYNLYSYIVGEIYDN